MHGIITSTDYSAGVQTTFRAGGCNCSRGGFIGACLAAQVRVEKETIHVMLNEHNKVSLFIPPGHVTVSDRGPLVT